MAERLRGELHGRFRDECLNREQLWTLKEPRGVIEDYRQKYNQRRPRSRLGYQSPARFAAQLVCFRAASWAVRRAT